MQLLRVARGISKDLKKCLNSSIYVSRTKEGRALVCHRTSTTSNRALALLLNLTDYCTSKFSALCRCRARVVAHVSLSYRGADIFIGSDREHSPPRLSPLQRDSHAWLRGTHAPTIFSSLFIFSQEDRISWQRVTIICNIHVVGKSRVRARFDERETSSSASLFPPRRRVCLV